MSSSGPRRAPGPARGHYDVVVVGSGFGGGVAALRATEKGYSVAVLEVATVNTASRGSTDPADRLGRSRQGTDPGPRE